MIINIKSEMLLKKVCDFYWYDLKIDKKKVEIINKSNKDFTKTFSRVDEALKYFVDTMMTTDRECATPNDIIWGNECIKYINSL